MIWHPLIWAFWIAAITGGVLYGLAAVGAMDVVLSWDPTRMDVDQLRRERRAETAGLMGRWALACLAVAAGLGLTGVALVWHQVIPGAMCGTGVLQALGTDGSRAMLLWLLGLSILYAWRVLDRLDHRCPEGVLTRQAARAMLLAAPFLVLAFFYAWQALMRVDTVAPVSCCAAIYDRVLDSPLQATTEKHLASVYLWGSLAGSALLLVLTIGWTRHPQHGWGILPAVVAIPWAIGCGMAVKQVWSAYYYQVLSHPCPWCLFLPDYHGVGFFIFGAITVVVMESLALWLVVRHRRPILADAADRRIRRAACRIVVALIAVTLLTVGPAIAWRLRNGVWLDGGF